MSDFKVSFVMFVLSMQIKMASRRNWRLLRKHLFPSIHEIHNYRVRCFHDSQRRGKLPFKMYWTCNVKNLTGYNVIFTIESETFATKHFCQMKATFNLSTGTTLIISPFSSEISQILIKAQRIAGLTSGHVNHRHYQS